MKQVQVAVFFADGFEEVEGITIVDFLRRAGIVTFIAGVGSTHPTGSHGIKIQADVDVHELGDDLNAVILPGGLPGSQNLADSQKVGDLCCKSMERGNLVAAICAAPALALGSFGLLQNKSFTCYPGFEKHVSGGNFVPDRVVIDKNLITSQGPGTAGEFAVEIARYLVGDEKADSVAKAALIRQ